MNKTLEKPLDHYEGITYTAWPHSLLKKTPVTKKHLGKQVWIAGESRSHKAVLREIHQPGDDMWPRGGFTIQQKGVDYLTSHFPDEVRAIPPKKKKARSQLARKVRDGEQDEPVIPEQYWEPEDADERDVPKEPDIYSTDMTAKEAKSYIKDTPIGKLDDFVPEDEDRVTVNRAWKEKNQKARDKISTDMNAADAAKYIRDTPLKNLLGFVPEDETRKTVTDAWEKKSEDK